MIGLFGFQRNSSGGVFGNILFDSTIPLQDTENPVIPGVLSVSGITTTGFSFSWSAATDNIGVVGYEVSVDTGIAAYTPQGMSLAMSVSSLNPATQYIVRVRAYDAAGNKSTALTTQVTTAMPADTASPVFVGTMAVTNITTSGFTVTWPNATDNIGVVKYEVSVDTGTPEFISVGFVRTKTFLSLLPGTLYNIRVRAVDASDNRSAALNATVTTAGVAPDGPLGTIVQKVLEKAQAYQLSRLSNVSTQITYKANTSQELILFNNGTTAAIVLLKGSDAGSVTTKGLAGVTVDLSGGLPIEVPPKQFVTLKLDNAVLYLKGSITLTASPESTVYAGVLQ